MINCSLVDFCLGLVEHRELQTRLHCTPSLPPHPHPPTPTTRLQFASSSCPRSRSRSTPLRTAIFSCTTAPRCQALHRIARLVSSRTLVAMADDTTTSASAQDPTLSGEGAADTNALDQGRSQLSALVLLHASPATSTIWSNICLQIIMATVFSLPHPKRCTEPTSSMC